MKEQTTSGPKERVIFSLTESNIAVLNELAWKSHRPRSTVVGMLIDHAKDNPEIAKILGGAA
jgi:hypothetical protein